MSKLILVQIGEFITLKRSCCVRGKVYHSGEWVEVIGLEPFDILVLADGRRVPSTETYIDLVVKREKVA